MQDNLSKLEEKVEAQETACKQADAKFSALRLCIDQGSREIVTECAQLLSHLGTARNEIISQGADMCSQLAEVHAQSRKHEDTVKVCKSSHISTPCSYHRYTTQHKKVRIKMRSEPDQSRAQKKTKTNPK